MAAVRRENYTPSKSAVLCSSHFLEQDLDRTSLCCVRVREGAIPKVFEAFPTHLKRKTIQRKPPAKRLKLLKRAFLAILTFISLDEWAGDHFWDEAGFHSSSGQNRVLHRWLLHSMTQKPTFGAC